MQIDLPAEMTVMASCEAIAQAEMTVMASSAVLPASYADSSLDASLQWLQSEPLSEEEQEAIARGVVDGSQKLLAFQFIMATRRARRMVRSQGWLDDIQQRLMSEEVLRAQQGNPFYALSVGRFIRDLQQDDTAFIQSLSKVESEALVEARQAAEKKVETEGDELTKKILAIPPHKREKIRKMMEALKQEEEAQ